MTLFFDDKIIADLIWDVKIDLSESFKTHIKSTGLDEKEKISILTNNLPKYIWIATCYVGTHKVFEFTFDATDVSNGMISKHLICYLPVEWRKILLEFLNRNKNYFLDKQIFKHWASIDYYEFLINKFS